MCVNEVTVGAMDEHILEMWVVLCKISCNAYF